ncbi:hypothetical protein M1446_02550 [Candidatus Dependentiae bacterium]|nr:hypothetical protein [Candidatus Dependentiae bacterium]
MSLNPFELFIQLVEFDKKLIENQRRKELIQAEIDELKKQIEDGQLNLAKIEQVYHTLQKKVHSLELDLKVTDEQIKKAQNRLDNAANPKEYYSSTNELQKLNLKRSEIDDSLLTLYSEVEVAKKDFQTAVQEFKKFNEENSKLVTDKEQILKAFNEEIDKAEKERPSKLEGFPKEWLEKYNNMKKSVSNPVVQVTANTCSACFYSVNPADMAALKHNKLISCKDCYRLLYRTE